MISQLIMIKIFHAIPDFLTTIFSFHGLGRLSEAQHNWHHGILRLHGDRRHRKAQVDLGYRDSPFSAVRCSFRAIWNSETEKFGKYRIEPPWGRFRTGRGFLRYQESIGCNWLRERRSFLLCPLVYPPLWRFIPKHSSSSSAKMWGWSGAWVATASVFSPSEQG